jgi:hypothetical protein
MRVPNSIIIEPGGAERSLKKIWGIPTGRVLAPLSTKAVQFDGTDDIVTVTDDDAFSPTDGATDTPFSISAWVYVGDIASDNGPFVTKSNNTLLDRNEYIFKHANGVLQFFIYDSAATAQGDAIRALASASSLSSATWHHVVATYDGSGSQNGMNLYTDGSSTASAKSQAGTYVRLRNTTTPLTFGSTEDGANVNRRFEDYLADICYFNKELSAAEVLEIFNGTAGVVGSGRIKDMNNFSDTSSIVGWWQMGDGDSSGTDGILDSIGSNNGTLQNGAKIVQTKNLKSDYITKVL